LLIICIKNNEADIFEQNQADLERFVEELSGNLEKEFDGCENTIEKIKDKYRYVDQRRQILLDHCKEGYDRHYWGGLDPY